LQYWTQRGMKLWRMWRLNECQCLSLSNESWQNIGLCLWWCKLIPTKSKLQKLNLQIHFELYVLCLNFALVEVHWEKWKPIIGIHLEKQKLFFKCLMKIALINFQILNTICNTTWSWFEKLGYNLQNQNFTCKGWNFFCVT
jgi:hypothetical protein